MNLNEIVIEFLKLKFRIIHPSGKMESGGRWYPYDMLKCCNSIRRPSRAYPWGLMSHCRSALHVATEHGIDVKDLKEGLKKKNLPLYLGIDPSIDQYISTKLKGKG